MAPKGSASGCELPGGLKNRQLSVDGNAGGWGKVPSSQQGSKPRNVSLKNQTGAGAALALAARGYQTGISRPKRYRRRREALEFYRP